jgi:hypothetical protein
MEDVRSMALDVTPIIYEVAYVGERQTSPDGV